MELKELARRLPDDIWAEVEPVLPAVAWQGNGRPPVGNRECLHALLYVLASGVAGEMLPWCFPSYKTVQRRLTRWLDGDAFRVVWRRLAERYERRHGINWDRVLPDGSKKPSEKGARRRGHRRWIAERAGRPATSPATAGPCPPGSS